jgi:hypothetical protein
VIPTSRQNQDRWKSAVEVAAALCAPNCFRPPPAGLSLTCAPAGTDRAEPSRRFPPRNPAGWALFDRPWLTI